MARKRVSVTKETDSGRNTRFHDNYTGKDMTLKQFVSEIKKGNYEGYYTRNINEVETPVSKPDGKEGNNLG